MKKIFMFIAIIVLTTLIVNGINHNKKNHMRFNREQKSEMRNNHEQKSKRFNHNQKPECKCDSIRFDKNKTAYVEVGNLLKPYEVANLMINNLL